MCPDAVVVPARMSAYSEASKALFDVFNDISGRVEGLSIDEAFLDVRGLRRLYGSPVDIAARLRREARERVGLPVSVGIARTKFLAKVASGVSKPTASWSWNLTANSNSSTPSRSKRSGVSVP